MAPFAEGAPCWADAMLPDLEAGKRFYGDLFGWTFDEEPREESGFYTQAFLDGEPVAALMPKQDGRMPTAWGIHLAAPDLAATTGRIQEAGGTLISEPVEVGPFGRMAVAADPDGAVFSAWQAGTHPGFGVQNVPGSFCWTEVYVRDAKAADEFYPAVFGYRLGDPPFDAGEFKVWALPGTGQEVGGRAVIGEGMPAETPPYFLVYFAVADVAGTISTVRGNGGRVLLEQQTIPVGSYAVVADNQGAVFAVMDGTEESGQE